MTGGSPFPFMQVQVAFASNPLGGSYTWADISSNVTQIQIRRGRQHVLNSFQPGTLSVTLDGRDGIFDPTNPSSTYYPNVDINRRVQVLAWWNLLTSTAGGNTLSSGWSATASSNTLAYFSGHMEFKRASGTGDMSATTASGTAGFSVDPNVAYSGMALFQASSTSASANVTLSFYDPNGNWLASSNSPNVFAASSTPIQAQVTAVSPPNATTGALATTVKAATVGLKYAITQPAVQPGSANYSWYAGGGQPIFTGFTDSWVPSWDSNLDTSITMNASDGLRLLAQANFGTTLVQSVVQTDGATNLWTLGDSSPSILAADVIGNATGTYSNVTLGMPGVSTVSPVTSASFVGNSYMQIPNSAAINTTGAFSLETWVNTTSAITQAIYSQGYFPPLGLSYFAIFMSVGGPAGSVTLQASSANQAYKQIDSAGTINDGNWHLVTVIRDGSGNLSLYLDGASSCGGSGWTGNPQVTPNTTTMWGNNFLVNSPADPFTGEMQYLALYPGVTLTPTQILNHYNTGLYGIKQTDSATFEKDLLNQITWPSADSSIAATGYSQIPTLTTQLTGTSALSQMQSVEKAENGALFANMSGQITFQNRYTIITGPNNISLATFGDNAGEILYKPSPVVALDDIDLFNSSVVTRAGGVAQSASSSTSITNYGASSSPLMASTLTESGLLLTTDVEALNRAQWNVTHYSTPLTRVRQLTVDVLGDIVNRFPQTVLRELRDRVTVRRRPYTKAGGFPVSQFAQDSYIEGITHTIDATQGTWQVTLALSPAETQAYWILGDATYGKLDTTTRLAY